MQGNVTIIIEGENLLFEQLDNDMGINATKYVSKGEKISNTKKSMLDRWIYKEKFDIDGFEKTFDSILDRFLLRKKEIHRILREMHISINVYITSELAQIGYSITSMQLKKLDALGLDVNFHIFSYGMVENN